MADQDYSVKIQTQGDPSGAKAVEKSLNDTGKAAKSLGTEAKEAASLTDELGRRGSNAKDVYEGLTQTLNGGTGAIFGLSKAWSNLKAAFAANPFSAIIAVIAALGPVIYSFIQGLRGAEQATDASGKAAQAANEKLSALQQTMAKLSQERFEMFKTNIEAVTQRFQTMRREMDLVQAAADKLDNAEMAAQLAENKVMPGLDDAERERNDIAIRRRFAQAKLDREEKARVDREKLAADELAEKQKIESEAAARFRAQAGVVDPYRQRVADAERRQAELQVAMEKTPQQIVKKVGGGEEALVANPEFVALQKELAEVQRRLDTLKSEPMKNAAQIATTELQNRASAFQLATEQANAAFKALRDVQSSNSIERSLVELSRGPQMRQSQAERTGTVADLRGQGPLGATITGGIPGITGITPFGVPEAPERVPETLYTPETRVRDSASMREERAVNSALSEFFGGMDRAPRELGTVAQEIRGLGTSLRERDEALISAIGDTQQAVRDVKREMEQVKTLTRANARQ